MNRIEWNDHVERKTGNIGFRVLELVKTQKKKGLNFQDLTGPELNGNDGKVMIISDSDVTVFRTDLVNTPEEHRTLALDQNLRQLLVRDDCVHLISTGNVQRELGLSLVFSNSLKDGSFSVTMVRREGGGMLNQSLQVLRGEMLFVVANDVSLTVKSGSINTLKKAGVKVAHKWQRQALEQMLQ